MSRKDRERQKQQIFHEDSSDEEQIKHDQNVNQLSSSEEEEGEIISGLEQGEIASKQSQEQDDQQQLGGNSQGQNAYDSSEEDAARMQTQKRKRQLQWRQREQQQQKLAGFSQEQLLKKAFEDVEKTNKRVMLLRKKNQKRMEDLEKMRMTQQPYLVTGNTPYRGSAGEYPLITSDRSGRALLHPNYSLRVGEMRLGDFISKNIKEESTANYLNEVVKFENYAYQQRKKRRQHIE